MSVNEIARDALEAGFIRRTLDQLSSSNPLCEPSDGGLAALAEILDRERDEEALEWHAEFDGHDDPESAR